MYSMTTNFFLFFLTYEYSKYAEFYTDFKSVEIIGKKSTQKKSLPNTFYKLVLRSKEEEKLRFFTLFCFDTHIQIMQRKSFYVILALF
jgi:hypothetical protein